MTAVIAAIQVRFLSQTTQERVRNSLTLKQLTFLPKSSFMVIEQQPERLIAIT